MNNETKLLEECIEKDDKSIAQKVESFEKNFSTYDKRLSLLLYSNLIKPTKQNQIYCYIFKGQVKCYTFWKQNN